MICLVNPQNGSWVLFNIHYIKKFTAITRFVISRFVCIEYYFNNNKKCYYMWVSNIKIVLCSANTAVLVLPVDTLCIEMNKLLYLITFYSNFYLLYIIMVIAIKNFPTIIDRNKRNVKCQPIWTKKGFSSFHLVRFSKLLIFVGKNIFEAYLLISKV